MTRAVQPAGFADPDVAALARLCSVELSTAETRLGREYLTSMAAYLATLDGVEGADDDPIDPAARDEHAGGPARAEATDAADARPSTPARELADWTAWETADAVRRGDVSATEVTQAALDRIAATDANIHAWLRVDERGALAAARAVDDARARGEPLGPLAGVPTGLKDNFVTADLETTAGSRILMGWVPAEDGAHARRLREAGAVILGKQGLDEFGMGSSNENTSFGPVRNPWARDFVPGGSSGGSAAAVASRTVPFALGSDSGGSIRQPASLTGLVGLKPTYGRVSRRGLIAFVSSLDQAGPLTRDVRDAALVLASLAGHDPHDLNTLPAPVPDYLAAVARGRADGVAGLRVGIHHQAIAVPGLDPAVRACFEQALAELAALGAELLPVDLPHFRHAIPTYYALAGTEATSNLARFDGARYGLRIAQPDFRRTCTVTRSHGFGIEVKRRLLLGTHLMRHRPGTHEQAMRVRAAIARDHAAVFAACDVLASPTTRLPGFRLGERFHDPLAMYLSDIFVVGANLARLPALSLPAGFAPATPQRPRLPVGLHLVAPPLCEPRLLRVAAAYEGPHRLAPRAPAGGRRGEPRPRRLAGPALPAARARPAVRRPRRRRRPVRAGPARGPCRCPIRGRSSAPCCSRCASAPTWPRSRCGTRRHRFDPGLPRGYQITQRDAPLARGGSIAAADRRWPLAALRLAEALAGPGAPDRGGAPLVELVAAPLRGPQRPGGARGLRVRRAGAARRPRPRGPRRPRGRALQRRRGPRRRPPAARCPTCRRGRPWRAPSRPSSAASSACSAART